MACQIWRSPVHAGRRSPFRRIAHISHHFVTTHCVLFRTTPRQRRQQYHTPPSLQKQAASTWSGFSTLQPLSYDGTVELIVPDIECLAKAREDDFYKDVVRKDEEKFFEPDVAWTVGWEEVYVRNGKLVDMPFSDTERKKGGDAGDSHYVEVGGGG